MAFLTQLKILNDEYKDKAVLLSAYDNEIAIAEANIVLYDTEITSADEELTFLASQMAAYNPNDQNYKNAKIAAEQVTAKKQSFQAAYDAAEAKRLHYQDEYDTTDGEIETILTSKKTLKFISKPSLKPPSFM